MSLKESENGIFYRVCRQAVYFVLIFAFIFGIHFLARVYGADTFEENGVVENMQLLLLLFSSFSFLWQIKENENFAKILLLLSSCCLMAACRELDSTFDKIVPFVHWKFAFLFPLMTFIHASGDLVHFKRNLFKFFAMPAFDMMYITVILILPVAQCIGHGAFVESVLGSDRVSDIKEFYEEAMEIVGYFLIFLSSIEMHFNLKEESHQAG